MNYRLQISILALAIGLAPSAIRLTSGGTGQTDERASEKPFDVGGEVKLFLATSGAPVKDASKVVVWLTPRGVVRTAHVVTPREYRMVQRNKMFEPSLLVVPIGSLVDFPNLDPWFHNVFSLYRGKRFDLGLYEAGAHKEIRFDRPGASYIFCNIHPEMAAVIMTVDSDFYGISDKSGHVSIPNVPAGKYLLHVWYENATAQALIALDRSMDIAEGANLPAISVPVTQQTAAKHKNKYGQDYDPKPGSSDYQN
jgi:plastocyanin